MQPGPHGQPEVQQLACGDVVRVMEARASCSTTTLRAALLHERSAERSLRTSSSCGFTNDVGQRVG